MHTWNALDKDGVILQLKLNENLHNYRVLNNRTKNLTSKKERTQVAAALVAGAPEPHPTSLQRQQRKLPEEARRRLGRKGRAEREPSHRRENERLARQRMSVGAGEEGVVRPPVVHGPEKLGHDCHYQLVLTGHTVVGPQCKKSIQIS